MPSATFTHSATVAATSETVWGAIDEPDTWSSIAGVERIHHPVFDDEGRLRGFLFDTVIGGTAYEGEAKPLAREEGRLISWAIANSQVKGEIQVELSEAGKDTTLITVTVVIASVGFLAGMFFGSISNVVGNGLPTTVEDLAARLADSQ